MKGKARDGARKRERKREFERSAAESTPAFPRRESSSVVTVKSRAHAPECLPAVRASSWAKLASCVPIRGRPIERRGAWFNPLPRLRGRHSVNRPFDQPATTPVEEKEDEEASTHWLAVKCGTVSRSLLSRLTTDLVGSCLRKCPHEYKAQVQSRGRDDGEPRKKNSLRFKRQQINK